MPSIIRFMNLIYLAYLVVKKYCRTWPRNMEMDYVQDDVVLMMHGRRLTSQTCYLGAGQARISGRNINTFLAHC